MVLQPTMPVPLDLEAGDVLVLGNLYGDPAWADKLDADLGAGAGAALIDAFLA